MKVWKKKAEKQSHGQFHDAWKRLKKNNLAFTAIIILLIIVLASIFADYIMPYDYTKQEIRNSFATPSWEHIMATDNFGRDLFSRILKGGQISLLVSAGAVSMALIIGGLFGATAAYFGGVYGNTVMRVMDIILSIPGFLMAVAISTALGTGVVNSIIAIGFSLIPSFARILHAAVLTEKDQEYVEAAIATGASHFRVLIRYIIPNTLASLIVNATLRLGSAIMQISSLSFIGLGVQPPQAEWGSILNVGRQYIRDYQPLVIFPGLVIVITLICFNLVGDGLRDALDPRLKQ